MRKKHNGNISPGREVRTKLLKAKTIRSVMDNLINPQNASFLLQLYDEYLRDENSVDPQWKSFFSTLPGDASLDLNIERPASWATSKTEIIAADRDDTAAVSNETRLPADDFDARQSILDSLRAITLIRAYRIRGHP